MSHEFYETDRARGFVRGYSFEILRGLGPLSTALWGMQAGRVFPGADEPPMTRFLAEQLSTAHWFDQRRTRADLDWAPEVTLDEGFRRLAASYR